MARLFAALVLASAILLSACSSPTETDGTAAPSGDSLDPAELVLTPADLPRSLFLDEAASGYLEEIGKKVWGDDRVRMFKRYGGAAGYTTNYNRQGQSTSAFAVLALRSAVWVHASEKGARDHFDYLKKNLAKGWNVAGVPELGDETHAAVTEQTLSDGQRRVLVQLRVRKGRSIADVTTATAKGALIPPDVLDVARLAAEKLP